MSLRISGLVILALGAAFASAATASPLMAVSADTAALMQDGVDARLSMAGPLFDGQNRVFSHGNAWAEAVTQKGETDEYGRYHGAHQGYKSELAGLLVGYDHGLGDYRVGMSLLGMSGDIDGRGSLRYMKSDADLFGVSLYGTWTGKKVNVIGDVGYIAGRNDLNNGFGDTDTESYFAGVKFETAFTAGGISFVPYYGVRFEHHSSDDVGSLSFSDVNVWKFPIGVNAGYEFTCRAGWKTRFMADAAVIPTAGDRKTYTDGNGLRVTDSLQYRFKTGLNTTKGQHAFGLTYGAEVAAHGRFNQTAVINYQFMY